MGAYYTAAQYILGIQPDYYGLKINPCIPAGWKEIKINRKFRNSNFNITIHNKNGSQKGVKKITLNGEPVDGNLIPLDLFEKNNEVVVEM